MLGLDAGSIVSFLAAGIALNLTPGADVMFATASGLAGGPRAGLAAAAGVALGSVLHTVLAAAGLAALLAAAPGAFAVVRWLGAAYLIWLSAKAWRAGPPEPMPGSRDLVRAVRRGFVTNALNPKVALFILAFLPQFTQAEAGPAWAQMLLLGGLFSATGLVVTGGYGALAGVAGQKLLRASGWLNKLAAVVFAGLALRLVLD